MERRGKNYQEISERSRLNKKIILRYLQSVFAPSKEDNEIKIMCKNDLEEVFQKSMYELFHFNVTDQTGDYMGEFSLERRPFKETDVFKLTLVDQVDPSLLATFDWKGFVGKRSNLLEIKVGQSGKSVVVNTNDSVVNFYDSGKEVGKVGFQKVNQEQLLKDFGINYLIYTEEGLQVSIQNRNLDLPRTVKPSFR